jgi:hypothetical protein
MTRDVETGLFDRFPVNCGWVKVQVVATGKVPQLKLTVPVKPLTGVIVIVTIPVCPSWTVRDGVAVS